MMTTIITRTKKKTLLKGRQHAVQQEQPGRHTHTHTQTLKQQKEPSVKRKSETSRAIPCNTVCGRKGTTLLGESCDRSAGVHDK